MEKSEEIRVDTILRLALDFVGIKNINLLEPIDQFGKLNLGANNSASACYAKLSPATRVFFPRDDCDLMPIMPTTLVNGCEFEGIGTGWSSFIPKYNSKDVIANIMRRNAGESMVPMDPWYHDFEGTIEKTESDDDGSTYRVTGVCDEHKENTLVITILPIRRWADEYKEFLRTMKTDNGPFIQDITEYNGDSYVNFKLKLSEENMMKAQQEGFLKVFKPTTMITTTNMHVFDRNGVIKKYATPEQILEDFSILRLEHYEKKKKEMLENLELKRQKLEEKRRFIRLVRSGEIVLKDRTKADLVEELSQRGFTPFPGEAPVDLSMDASEESELEVEVEKLGLDDAEEERKTQQKS
ncbi:unnamed protein product [Arabis nemorensis]|uniref:DNA topoisomerase (ATP-hydrolyzing) n=1 Tax=Arabis nemorensis TaxID=586526 RepID=A0A565B697_9BRAS|nr:unnamed protein product [Arabis nemorensis]